MPEVRSNDANVAYMDTEGSGPVVVFSHGILMDKDMFVPQVDALADEFRCITWDQRGHGDTRSAGEFSYWDSADDLIGVLDRLEIERAFLVGMSQGGFVSLRVALRYPERVRGLGLINTQAGTEDPTKLQAYGLMALQWIQEGLTEDLAAAVAAIIVSPADPTMWVERWMKLPADSIGEPFAALAGRDDLTDRLGEISAPAVVIHGEADTAIPMAQAESLATGLACCDGLVRIAGGGHASNLSHPGIVTESLREFFRRHAA